MAKNLVNSNNIEVVTSGDDLSLDFSTTVKQKIEQIEINKNDIANLKGKILWTNPRPSENFIGQTVKLSSSDYDTLTILYIDYRANQRMQSITIKKGESANLSTVFLTGSQLYISTRQMDYVDDTHYTFDDCHSATNISITTLNGSSPAQCIPALIIGYKTGLFG